MDHGPNTGFYGPDCDQSECMQDSLKPYIKTPLLTLRIGQATY